MYSKYNWGTGGARTWQLEERVVLEVDEVEKVGHGVDACEGARQAHDASTKSDVCLGGGQEPGAHSGDD